MMAARPQGSDALGSRTPSASRRRQSATASPTATTPTPMMRAACRVPAILAAASITSEPATMPNGKP